jgi:hypothetical protein
MVAGEVGKSWDTVPWFGLGFWAFPTIEVGLHRLRSQVPPTVPEIAAHVAGLLEMCFAHAGSAKTTLDTTRGTTMPGMTSNRAERNRRMDFPLRESPGALHAA